MRERRPSIGNSFQLENKVFQEQKQHATKGLELHLGKSKHQSILVKEVISLVSPEV